MAKKQMVIITGMSGAGKTVVANKLEDLGFFCVDNLPPQLVDKFVEIFKISPDLEKVALVLHASYKDNDLMKEAINKLKEKENAYVIFLDASDDTLVKRYKETRRVHPLGKDISPLDGIEKEREALTEIKGLATNVIDTSNRNAKDLMEEVETIVSDGSMPFRVTFMSFGYKYGLPIDLDLAFDVRFLPNPFYVEDLREKTGNDHEVYDYVMQKDETKEFIDKLTDLIDYLLPKYKKEGKLHVVIGIGCSGGKHRSVTLARYLTTRYSEEYTTNVIHRDAKRVDKKN